MKIFHVKPIGKPRMTQRDKFDSSAAAKRYWAYKEEVLLRAGRWLPENGDIIHFYMPFPKRFSKKKRAELAGKYHQQTPDIDNLLKAFYDCFGEDKHLADVHIRKFWAAEGSIQVWRGDDSR